MNDLMEGHKKNHRYNNLYQFLSVKNCREGISGLIMIYDGWCLAPSFLGLIYWLLVLNMIACSP